MFRDFQVFCNSVKDRELLPYKQGALSASEQISGYHFIRNRPVVYIRICPTLSHKIIIIARRLNHIVTCNVFIPGGGWLVT